MKCPGCGAAMPALEFERLQAGGVYLDFCFPCQVVWFDQYESPQLAPAAVLEVFKAIGEHHTDARNALPELLDCPRCGSRLLLTQDLQHATRFSYYRCPWGHGRLTPFFQFLREKNFVRPVTAAELAAIKAKIRTVHCSNCGAPIDLEHDSVCTYCRSPLAILDPDAVAKTVKELDEADARRKAIDVDRLAEALLMQPPSAAGSTAWSGGTGAGDLVAAGIAAVAALIASR